MSNVDLQDPAGGAGEAPPDDGGPPGGGSEGAGGGRPRRGAKRLAIEWTVIVAVALVVAVLLRLFVIQTFYIPSTSMTPTLNVGNRIIVNKLAYKFHGVGRGDIIVFKAPAKVATVCGDKDADLVKRVIGLPGETISDRSGTVYIDGKALNQTWLPKNDPNTYTPSFAPVKIPANNYFVMGDNRTVSCDSRYWGTVTRSEIIGKAELLIWPVDRLRFF